MQRLSVYNLMVSGLFRVNRNQIVPDDQFLLEPHNWSRSSRYMASLTSSCSKRLADHASKRFTARMRAANAWKRPDFNFSVTCPVVAEKPPSSSQSDMSTSQRIGRRRRRINLLVRKAQRLRNDEDIWRAGKCGCPEWFSNDLNLQNRVGHLRRSNEHPGLPFGSCCESTDDAFPVTWCWLLS
ncbi:hypothetical protein BDV96DRAFT_96346 [Lophiotrema nucula]|uniref:Uncharacterized protein n=1 Tax=Lophiotrema nucula TaxID=690887 RepID=A0A6A5Z5M3_9PLEO|nr:hypothetical protein BDV96DRAFT_96346 [Lophiotrema nucula]